MSPHACVMLPAGAQHLISRHVEIAGSFDRYTLKIWVPSDFESALAIVQENCRMLRSMHPDMLVFPHTFSLSLLVSTGVAKKLSVFL